MSLSFNRLQGRVTEARDVHPLKASSPIANRPLGRVTEASEAGSSSTEASDVQPLKASSPMVNRPLGRVTEASDVHPLKALFPMVNLQVPMVVLVSGKSTETRDMQSLKKTNRVKVRVRVRVRDEGHAILESAVLDASHPFRHHE